MSAEPPRRHSPQHRSPPARTTPRARRPPAARGDADDRNVAARVEDWSAPATGRPDAPAADDPATDDPAADRPTDRDARPRRWDVLNPAATRIGYAADPDDDVGERLRALHAERDARVRGGDERRARLDVARVTQAVCNALDLTAWERDRVLGVVCELDPAAVGTRESIPGIALAVARRVVDAERRARLGLDDPTPSGRRSPGRLADLADRFRRLTDGEAYGRLLAECGLGPAAVEHLTAALEGELDDGTLEAAVFGRSPYRDPALPPFERYAPAAGD